MFFLPLQITQLCIILGTGCYRAVPLLVPLYDAVYFLVPFFGVTVVFHTRRFTSAAQHVEVSIRMRQWRIYLKEFVVKTY